MLRTVDGFVFTDCVEHCANGYEVDGLGCQTCTCKPSPEPCPPVLCRMACKDGWAKDDITGCDICACAPPPAPSTCEPVRCMMACEHGWAKDETTGRDICSCAPPPNTTPGEQNNYNGRQGDR